MGALLALLAACGTGGDTTATTTAMGRRRQRRRPRPAGLENRAGPPENRHTTASASGATGGSAYRLRRLPDSLNPGLGLLAEGYIMYELVYDTPITIDLDGNYVPELAEEWSVSDDGLTWTLDLVEGATFHVEPRSPPMTSSTHSSCGGTTRTGPISPPTETYLRISKAPDEQTVTITLTNPVGNFESRMVFMYVVPKAIWEEVEDPVAFDNAEMIGSGPFAGGIPAGRVRPAEANDDYWGHRPMSTR